jgi:hypothetical protein
MGRLKGLFPFFFNFSAAIFSASLMAFPPGSILDPSLTVTLDINGSSFQIWDNYRTEIVAQDVHQQGATWQFQCLWDERFAIAEALVGGGVAAALLTVFNNGWPYPSNGNWLAKKVTMKPDAAYKEALSEESDDGDLAEFQRALMICEFGIPDYQNQQNNTGEQELDFCSNSVPQSNQVTSFWWADTKKPLPADMNLPITYTTIKFTQTLFNRSYLNIPLFSSLTDHINSVSFGGSPSGTVLFRGGRSRRKITPKGALNWDITLNFEINNTTMNGTQSGWNKLWRPANTGGGVNAGWFPFSVKGDGSQSLFTSADLNQLFL